MHTKISEVHFPQKSEDVIAGYMLVMYVFLMNSYD